MKVFYSKGKHVIIHFPAKELKQALGVLKALAKYFGAKFLTDVAEDLERDLQPRLPYTQHIHICENCFTEVDDRGKNWVHVDDAWVHRECPTLKPKPVRDR